MLKLLRLALRNKGENVSKVRQERWTGYLWNYYKKSHNNKNDLEQKWKGIRAKWIADRIEEDKIIRIKKSYEYYKIDVKQVDSSGNRNIGSNILRSKDQSILNKKFLFRTELNELNIKHNKWLNYFNSKRNKEELTKKNKNTFNRLLEGLKYVINNISEGHKEDLESRKISNKLLIPNYYFPSKYIENSKGGQAKHWMTSVYSFLKKEGASLTLLDRFTTELIQRFFAVKRIKRRIIDDKLLSNSFKFNASKPIYKQLNRIIKFSRQGGLKVDSSITTYFHPGILKSKWLKRQISKSIKVKNKLLKRRMNLFGGFDTKKTSGIGKWNKVLLAKPIFKHTPFNVVIDLFIFNNKGNQKKRLKNLMLRRFAYKYMYSLYIDVYKKVNETLNRPRFFYINIIEPKMFPYYTKVVKSYEEWVFKYNRGVIITICLIILKMSEILKNSNKSLNKNYKFLLNNINFINKTSLLNHMYINILSKSGINYLFNRKKNKVDVISMYETKEDPNANKDKRSYKIKRYAALDAPRHRLNNKKTRQKITSIKLKTREQKKKYNERIKLFGEKKVSYNQYKKLQIYERRRGKQMDQKEFKEKLHSFHLNSHQKKQNESINERKYTWYFPEEWERLKKQNMNKDKNKEGKFNNSNKSHISKNNILFAPNNKNELNKLIRTEKNSNDLDKNFKSSKNLLNIKNKNEKINNNKILNIYNINENNFSSLKDNSTPYTILLSKFEKIQEQNRDLSNMIENFVLDNKDVKFKSSEELIESIGNLNLNQKEVLAKIGEEDQNSIKSIAYRKFFKNNFLLYWNYKVLQSNKAKLKVAKLGKNKKRKLRLKLEKEENNFHNTNIENLSKYYNNNKFWVGMLANSSVLLSKEEKKSVFSLVKEKSNYINKLNKKKRKIKSLNYYISKNKWLNKQTKIRKEYALKIIENMNLPIIKKRKRFQKRIDNNEINNNRLINTLSNYKLKVKSKNAKIIWDRLEYSILSILNKYLSVNGKNKLQLNSIYNEGKNMLIFSNIWYTIYSLSFIKNEYSNIAKSILVDKVFDRIPEESDQKLNSFNKGSQYTGDFNNVYKLSRVKINKDYFNSIYYKSYYGYSDNKREEEMQNKLFNYENIFKTYYRKIISLYIMEYYKHYLLHIWRNYWIHALNTFIIDKVKEINKSHVILLNFIIVKTLLGLLEYNYRSLIRLKPKYYYLNKLRYYQTKFKRINLNSWANSVKYVKKLRKTPNQFWRRYHRLASFYYGRIIQNAELDTKRKIFVPFVLYFEDVLYNIYGKWAIIRLWPLKRYYLSSYILARRLMALILWRANKVKTVTKFRRHTQFFLYLVKCFQITRGYYDYYKNSISEWPNSLLDMINEKRKEHYLTYKNLEYMIEKKERYFRFNTHLLLRNKLSYSNFTLWYKKAVGDKLIKKFKVKDSDDILTKYKYHNVDIANWLRVWLTPFRHHLHHLTTGHDITSFKFTLAGRTGTRRNNARKMYKMKFYGHTRILRYWAPIQKKYFNIGIPAIRNDMKSTYDYSKTISKSISGALSVKVWMTSKISVDIQELLMLLVDIKHLYSQLFNKYYLVAKRFLYGQDKKRKSKRSKKVSQSNWTRKKHSIQINKIKVNKDKLFKIKQLLYLRNYKILKNNTKSKYRWNNYYSKIKKQWNKIIKVN